VDIAQSLSTHDLRADPRNRSVPIFDVLHPPGEDDTVLIVMPLLRSFDSPPFDTVGEVVDFFTQILEVQTFVSLRRC
jgi:hypothetical protein